MPESVSVDTELLARAHALSGEKTELATVTAALEEYIAYRSQAAFDENRSVFAGDEASDSKDSHRRRDRALGLIE